MISVIVVDDQTMVRDAIATLLSLEPDIQILGKAETGQQAIELIRQLAAHHTPVDVAVMDIEMPDMSGLAATERIVATGSKTKILIVTTFGRPGYVQRAMNAGASGFIVKDAPGAQLADAIRKVHSGQQVIDRQLAVEALTSGSSPLSERETEVLLAVESGGSIDDIAAMVYLSPGTVRNHISNAMAKTNARNRSDAARIARRNGWL